MEIQHRISFSCLAGVEGVLTNLGINVRRSELPGGQYVVHLDIAESDPRWEEVSKLVREKQAADVYDTIFSAEEIRAAEWSRLIPIFEYGFPQPEKDQGWVKLVYDNVCPKCGAGFQQKAPFRLKQEPRVGGNHFMALGCTYALFAVPSVFEEMERHTIRGFEKWPAILHPSDEASQIVSQIIISEVAASGLVANDELGFETCQECNTTKYSYHRRGQMRLRREALPADFDWLLTDEWFGAGHYGGQREILVSNRLGKLILDNGWQGGQLKPVELV